MFEMTSMGAKVIESINDGRAPYVFKISGQVCHRVGSLMPSEGHRPEYAQLYIFDTEHEVSNRINVASSSSRAPFRANQNIVASLIEMLDMHNPIVKLFRTARERLLGDSSDQYHIRLFVASEVVGLIVSDIGQTDVGRDIIIEDRSSRLQRINEQHCKFMAMQYPILFPYGEDGYHESLMYRQIGSSLSLKRSKATMAESASSVGQRIILPASFTGSPRYLYQKYQDCIGICRKHGCPDLFITFTSNPAWPEIMEALPPGLQPSDRPDIIDRIFKMKLNILMDDIKKRKFFGPINADNFISAQLPDPTTDPIGYAAISSHMVHGPCGALNTSSPCMSEAKCSKFYPKQFCEKTTILENGFIQYARPKNGLVVTKNNVDIDNTFIVPHNVDLVVKYQAHIYVERVNHDGMHKYLFKYVTKGFDCARVGFHGNSSTQGSSNDTINEIQNYLECCYVTPHDAAWRLLQYDIHHTDPSVERLPVHLPFENSVVFTEEDDLEEVIENPNNLITKLIAWFEANNQFPAARERTYIEFPESKGKLALAVASSGIASVPLPGGRTPHSRFKFPLDIHENSMCSIKKNTHLAELIQQTSLIVWDEAPVNHKYLFEALDRSLRDILSENRPNAQDKQFGGITVALGGDFRQTLPVVQNATKHQILRACIVNSYLWRHCIVLQLTQNMRLTSTFLTPSDREDLRLFSEWLLRVGNGTEPFIQIQNEPSSTYIQIPQSLLLHPDYRNLDGLISFVYSSGCQPTDIPSYFCDRAILAPTNEVVTEINNKMISQLTTYEMSYYSSDSIDDTLANHSTLESLYPTEFLNTITINGLPEHVLKLKIGVPIMLLRNLDPSRGLCNGTRLIVTQLTTRVIEGEIIRGKARGSKAYIPRIITTSNQSKWPFKLKRRQFPIRLSYAMTINKSQGQTLNTVVISPKGLRIVIENSPPLFENCTHNIVYGEVFSQI
ncbi:hypothetical protein GQ55_5G311900 [Panicum hallii var. hallii]|uniref:ATP-dependent DNA helicase n=1 Tax=Panicum hallii var. hallii TaxID=1504633 RepID=A0A2T7DLN7_9POAL|nr:hypothetical protein GQ55_5G311900 [Panicum hallii var. hallii]